jgi:hypothetical protein
MLKISIPTPCHEDWSKMTPNEAGRHCSSCAKTVVDFTAMSDDEVKNYFIARKDEKLCGRFKQSQLHRVVIELHADIFRIEMPLWKRFLAACLIAFSITLFSCETKIKEHKEATAEVEASADGIEERMRNPCEGMVGMCSTDYDSTLFTNEVIVGGFEAPPPPVIDTSEIIKGDLLLVPADTLTQINRSRDTMMLKLPDSLAKRMFPGPVKDTIRIKNPPKQDSADCNWIKIFY